MGEIVITIPVYATMAKHLCRPLSPLEVARQRVVLDQGSTKAESVSHSEKKEKGGQVTKEDVCLPTFPAALLMNVFFFYCCCCCLSK